MIFFPAQSAFGCMRITKTGRALFDAHRFFTLESQSCVPCFGYSHTSKCGQRRKRTSLCGLRIKNLAICAFFGKFCSFAKFALFAFFDFVAIFAFLRFLQFLIFLKKKKNFAQNGGFILVIIKKVSLNRTFFLAQSAFECMGITRTGHARLPSEGVLFQ